MSGETHARYRESIKVHSDQFHKLWQLSLSLWHFEWSVDQIGSVGQVLGFCRKTWFQFIVLRKDNFPLSMQIVSRIESHLPHLNLTRK